jgi:hypothetical protein
LPSRYLLYVDYVCLIFLDLLKVDLHLLGRVKHIVVAGVFATTEFLDRFEVL